MPRFAYRFHTSLKGALLATRTGLALNVPDLLAIGPGDLVVGTAGHEAFMEVDEEGTCAAAATGMVIAVSHGPVVSVDRPLLFFVMDGPTGTVLFPGRVLYPRSGQE